MTVGELKQRINAIPQEFDTLEVFTPGDEFVDLRPVRSVYLCDEGRPLYLILDSCTFTLEETWRSPIVPE
jgi:hypothetical protein